MEQVMAEIKRLYACWYPSLQRTLTLLSKLYMTVDTRVFEGLAQEAIDACLDSLFRASAALTQRKGALDGQLFLVRHLLTLREQIAPFEVAFTQVTVALDFSHLRGEMRKALGGGFSSFFSLDALVPRVATESADAKKRLDQELTAAVEAFIVSWTKRVLQPLLSLLVQVTSFEAVQATAPQPAALADQNWATQAAFAQVAEHVRTSAENELPTLVGAVLAYLPPDQAAALLGPIRDNIYDSWDRLTSVYANAYPSEQDQQQQQGVPLAVLPELVAEAFKPLDEAVARSKQQSGQAAAAAQEQQSAVMLADPEDLETPVVLTTPTPPKPAAPTGQ